ncbi:MAG: DUF58 domain-containing protein [Azoarcus sp.]|jgi:uncharacterized protein (DUF58 family)|nr:DUF58 domain-containing protein [Azoarcus sp.]
MKNLMSRIILLPTATGVFWFMTALALLATAINYANNLVFALAFILLAIWLTAAWQCRRNLRGLVWRPVPEAKAFAGETLHLAGSVQGPAGRHDPVLLCAGHGRQRRRGPATLPSRATLELSLPAPERGRRRIGGLHLLSPHPLGLWQARRAVPDMTALIHPRPAGGQALPGKSPHPAHLHQEAGDFRGVRTYRPGDPPRRINWRIYGRRDEPAVNDFDGGHGGQSLWLDIAACEGEVETRLSQLCQWVREAERRGLEYGLRLGDGNDRGRAGGARPGRGRAHLDDCLRRLALYGGERSGQETTGPAPAAQPGGARS